MKLLLYDACSYTMDDIMDALSDLHISYQYVLYQLTDIYEDDFFTKRISEHLKSCRYDAVFSINYFPVLAQLCHDYNTRYISWSYDSPLHIPNIEKTLQYPTTSFFLFDRLEQESYIRQGFLNVYHLPLGVNAKRLSRIQVSRQEHALYDCDVSLVGQLYDSPLPDLLLPMTEYQKGYINAITQAQLSVYGYYFVEKLLSDTFLEQINAQFRKIGQMLPLQKHGLSAAIAKQLTHTERMVLLTTLGDLCRTDYYADRKDVSLSNARYRGTAGYYSLMPKVFQCSKINLNPTLRSILSGIPLRALDIMGSGGFLLSNYQPELAEYFVDGQELVLYTSLEDAVEKALFYKKEETLRQSIAQNGRKAVFSTCTYQSRLKEMFHICGLDK